MGWRGRRDFPIDRATGNAAVETEEASDERLTKERKTDLTGLDDTYERTLANSKINSNVRIQRVKVADRCLGVVGLSWLGYSAPAKLASPGEDSQERAKSLTLTRKGRTTAAAPGPPSGVVMRLGRVHIAWVDE